MINAFHQRFVFIIGLRINADLNKLVANTEIFYNNMQWDPPSFEQVTEDMVDAYFSPPNAYEPGLELPSKLREAFA